MSATPSSVRQDSGDGAAPRLPLAGLRVLELGHYIAGPFATRLLADLGAEVVKVEPPEGDPIRGWGSRHNGHPVWFSIHGRNKLSVTLDLKDPRDQARLKGLAARADALIENFRPGYLERIGLGPAVLHGVNPRLVIARISGYGQDGPYRDKPAFGAIGEAMGGLRHLTANPGQTELPPPRCGISISDDLAGMYAAMAVVSACWGRDAGQGGAGRIIDINLVDSVVSLMEGMLPEYGLTGKIRQPAGAAIPTAAPTNTYPCADGKWLCVAGNSDLIFRRLMAAIGRPELAADPRMADNAGRCAHAAELDAAIAAWTRTLPAKQAQDILEGAEVPCSRLYDIKDIAEDPHFRARDTVMAVQDPLIGQVLHPAAPFRFDGVAPAEMVRWTGPAIGAHNAQVFRDWLGEEG
ncbi:CaiB/BaiF CoA transferase family protein [Teichococcus cervicalis]|uniref:CoA-transferase family III protein n=2 Tax=Teichococcus cervicalis TaxID=204525 RepID=D5RSA5_9PROT|nr:CoA transferase [Pseudoroseomonas cervicalis]EFH09808.1 CoA-transferase family III protein [Pseudoroseomonas cervicalis ATCC 49957]WBV42296.1 CoA transferase [Pseudoroseomonas cervicalis]